MSDIYKIRFNGNTLCSHQTRQFVHKYKSFKWVLSGRWNQGSGNSGDTATYMEWDELGIAFDDDTVRYGPDYWTFDSYTLDGTPWSPNTRMPQVLLGGSWGTESSKFDASNFVELTVYFHTADNSAILPTRVGLISANNQNLFQSSTPLHFKLYGLNTQTNDYELLIDVGAADVNKTSNAETIITTGFTYHYTTVTDNWPLLYVHNEPVYEEWVNLGSTEYTQSSSGNRAVSLAGMPNASPLNYITFVLDASYVGSGQASDIMLCSSNDIWNSVIWRSRYHVNLGTGFVGLADSVTNWTTEAGQTISSKTQDGVSYRLSSHWVNNKYTRIKFVFDRINKYCYFYAENVLLGYATLTTDLITCKYFGIVKETSSGAYPAIKNIRVAGFSTLAAAQAYNG